MKKRLRFAFQLVLLFIAEPCAAEGRRFLLAFGENLGMADEAPLRYAELDARSFSDTMRSVGGVRSADAMLVGELTAEKVERSLAETSRRMREAGAGRDDLLFVYVSAHASEGALHLRGTRLPLSVLRNFVVAAPVGVAVLVVDTCNAAWQGRSKGLEPLDARSVTVERAQVEGRVFIASSGPTESALESDRFGGSYFTGHLVAALRGAGDTSQDGQVTLSEAFTYTYNRTIESSLGASGGQQTPQFEMALQGQREVVLSEPSKARGLLSLQIERPGDWVVTPLDGDGPAERFVKGSGPVIFALSPGVWRLRTSVGDSDLQDEVVIREGGVATIDEAALSAWARSPTRSKGQARVWMLGASGTVGSGLVTTSAGVLPGAGVFARRSDPRGLFGRTATLVFFEARRGTGEAVTDFTETELELGVGTGPERSVGPFFLRAGPIVAGNVALQSDTPRGDLAGFAPRLGVFAGGSLPVYGSLWLDLTLKGGGQRVRSQDGAHLEAFFGGGLALGVVL